MSQGKATNSVCLVWLDFLLCLTRKNDKVNELLEDHLNIIEELSSDMVWSHITAGMYDLIRKCSMSPQLAYK